MTTISVAAAIDPQGIVKSLMQAERVPLTRINTQVKGIESKISELGKLNKSLDDLNAQASSSMSKLSSATSTVDEKVAALVDLVKKYNETNTSMRNATGKEAKLQSDSSVNGARSQLRQAVSSALFGGASITNLPLKTDEKGALILDEGKLKDQLTSNPGLAAEANDFALALRNVSSEQGAAQQSLVRREEGYEQSVKRLERRVESAEYTLSKREATYLKQFTSLQKVLSDMENAFNRSGVSGLNISA